MPTCSSCLSPNDDHRRFCGRCGAALGDPCCGFLNNPDDRYCGGCGRLRVGQFTAMTDGADSDIADAGPIEWSEVMVEAAVVRDARTDAAGPQHLDQGELDSLFEG